MNFSHLIMLRFIIFMPEPTLTAGGRRTQTDRPYFVEEEENPDKKSENQCTNEQG